MSMQKHIDPEDLVLFAMQLLPAEDVASIVVHLEHNPSARQELAEIQGVLATVAFTADQHEPPALARTVFLKKVAREKRIQPALPQLGPTPGSATLPFSTFGRDDDAPRRGIVSRVMPWVGWAVAAALAVTAGNLYRERDALQAAGANDQAQLARSTAEAASSREVLNAFNDQTATRVTLTRQGAPVTPQGRTTYSAQKGVLIFTATNMEPLDTFKVYELWLIPTDGRDPIPAGIFKPDTKGYASLISTKMPRNVDAKAFGITIEDDGGSKTPTLPILMTGA